MFDLNQFIAKEITKRSQSMFLTDIEANASELKQKIEGKTLLVIGGAGSIGSSFIQAMAETPLTNPTAFSHAVHCS